MVLYFTGTGNSRYLARRIAEGLEMLLYDLNACIKAGDTAPVQTGRDVVLVTPTYAWRITRTLNKITLIGAIFLAVVAVLPIVLGNLTGMSIQLGGTSLLIVVGVALDTTRSLDSFMTMRSHKGFLG